MSGRELPSHIGKYAITRHIGAGGAGEVYAARDEGLERDVAIKVLKAEIAEDKTRRDRFLREGKMMARIRSPHVASIFAVGEHHGLPFLVMELLDGHDLEHRLKHRGAMSVADALNVVRQACLGLDAAAELDVIHRDVKPANIVLGTHGVKLTDFGLARPRDGSASVTTEGLVTGTPAFLAPERAMGKGDDLRSDIYSLGATLYTLLANRPPFVRDTPIEVITAHLKEEPEPLEEMAEHVDRHVAHLVRKMMRKDPGRRYQTYADVVSDLDMCLMSRDDELTQVNDPFAMNTSSVQSAVGAPTGVMGSLKQMSVNDITQMLEIGRKTATVDVEPTGYARGGLGVIEGQVVYACFGPKLLGEEAFHTLCRMTEGSFRIRYGREPSERNIEVPTQFLMLEAMRRIDEGTERAPPPMISEEVSARRPAPEETSATSAHSATDSNKASSQSEPSGESGRTGAPTPRRESSKRRRSPRPRPARAAAPEDVEVTERRRIPGAPDANVDEGGISFTPRPPVGLEDEAPPPPPVSPYAATARRPLDPGADVGDLNDLPDAVPPPIDGLDDALRPRDTLIVRQDDDDEDEHAAARHKRHALIEDDPTEATPSHRGPTVRIEATAEQFADATEAMERPPFADSSVGGSDAPFPELHRTAPAGVPAPGLNLDDGVTEETPFGDVTAPMAIIGHDTPDTVSGLGPATFSEKTPPAPAPGRSDAPPDLSDTLPAQTVFDRAPWLSKVDAALFAAARQVQAQPWLLAIILVPMLLLLIVVTAVLSSAGSAPSLARIDDGQAEEVLAELDALGTGQRTAGHELLRAHALIALERDDEAVAVLKDAVTAGAHDPRALAFLLAQLEEEQAGAAVDALVAWPGEEATPRLVALTERDHYAPRKNAVTVLEERGEDDRYDHFAVALKDLRDAPSCPERKAALSLVRKRVKKLDDKAQVTAAREAVEAAADRAGNDCMASLFKRMLPHRYQK